MNPCMRSYIEHLERDMPSQVVRVTKEVSPEFEIPAILQQVESRKMRPVLIFEKVRNLNGSISKLPLVINLFGSRERLADALGTTVPKLALEYVAREKPVAPVVVDPARAAVKQVTQVGTAADLYEMPIVTHHEMDLGPYLTSPSVWVKDPETGMTNCAILRVYVAGPRRLVANFVAARHTHHYFQKYKALNRNVPIILVIGHHPAFYIGAQTKLLVDEPEIIGGFMGEPLELTPSETWGKEIMVPAQADIVIEAEMSISELEIEAPFGEYTGYYGGQRLNPPAEVKAITRRQDAFYLDVMPGHADHILLDAPMVEAHLFNRIKAVVPGVTGVHMPVSGTARLHAYVQLRKSNDGEPKTVIATALSSDYHVKHVIVVDEDVDIYDDEQVLWAVATRSQWDKDLVVIPGMMGTGLDPSANDIITAKGGIDATMPVDRRSFPRKIRIPESVTSRIRLEDYLGPEALKQF
ncbi:MAG: UbiD family decarboxylase [Betaproteobacteria bacterium]|nr:UbiD family decarboxylase [Betaproteobacteria bacterium]